MNTPEPLREIKDYGFVAPVIALDQYILGASPLPKTIIRPDGQWGDFLPQYEPQFGDGWDSFGCSVWGTENCIEVIIKQMMGVEPNYSERFIYILGKIVPPGADPHHIAEVIRANGLIDDALLPMTKTLKEFVTPDPMTNSLLAKGQNWLLNYSFRHEWLWSRTPSIKDRVAILKDNLRYSPLGVSVTAWYQDENGLYVDKGQPNTHWCVLYGWNDQGWLVFDSYDQSHKVLSFNHNIQFAKRYRIEKKNTPELADPNVQEHIWLISYAIELLKKIIALMPKTNQEKLLVEAEKWLGKDASPGDKAPDEYGCAESVNEICLNALGYPAGGDVSTYRMKLALPKNKFFERVDSPEPGDILLYPTGFAKYPKVIPSGHVFIVSRDGKLMSNSSSDGIWRYNYTLTSAAERWAIRGGYTAEYWRAV